MPLSLSNEEWTMCYVIQMLYKASNEDPKGFPCKALWRNGQVDTKPPQQTDSGPVFGGCDKGDYLE